MLKTIDSLNIHPRNRLLFYDRHVLLKISWHFTETDLAKTWICENVDNIVAKYVRQWFDLPISATLGSTVPSRNHFGQVFQIPSISVLQRQTTLRSSLKLFCDEQPNYVEIPVGQIFNMIFTQTQNSL